MFLRTLSVQWNFRQFETTEWLPATVPCGVHTDLLALRKIPDPSGTSVSVTANMPTGWTESQAHAAIRVYSLIDSYQ